VGAVDKRGNRSYFSNFGGGLAITAPGGSGLPGADEDILSTGNDGGYTELAGTSQATPFVSGVAALLVSKGVRGQAAVARILSTAHDAGPVGPDATYGAGIVDAAAAVAGLGGAGGGPGPGATPPPAAVPPPAPATATIGITIGRRISRGGLLRRGLPVRCRAAGIGTCDVTARYGRTPVARGAGAGDAHKIRARARRGHRRRASRAGPRAPFRALESLRAVSRNHTKKRPCSSRQRLASRQSIPCKR